MHLIPIFIIAIIGVDRVLIEFMEETMVAQAPIIHFPIPTKALLHRLRFILILIPNVLVF